LLRFDKIIGIINDSNLGSGLNALKCKRGRLQHTKYYAFSVHAKL